MPDIVHDRGAQMQQADFRLAMRRLAATVSVITCSHRGQRCGMTATAVTSVCMAPPALLICVNGNASVHPAIRDSGRFCVNLLTERQMDISTLFGGKLPQNERFATGRWSDGEHGLPYLDEAQAAIFCELDCHFEYGTHSIFIGKVTRTTVIDTVKPLLYADGGFARLAS